eukprot:gene10848-12833_t
MAEAVFRDGNPNDIHVELRTLDNTFLRFAKCPKGSTIDETQELIEEDNVTIREWGHQMRLAGQRIENLYDYDQGVREINRSISDKSALGPFTGVWQVRSSRRYSILQTQETLTMSLKISELQIEENSVSDAEIRDQSSPQMTHGNAFCGKLGFRMRVYAKAENLIIHRSHITGVEVLEMLTLRSDGSSEKEAADAESHPFLQATSICFRLESAQSCPEAIGLWRIMRVMQVAMTPCSPLMIQIFFRWMHQTSFCVEIVMKHFEENVI